MTKELEARVAALEEKIELLLAARPRRVFMSDVIRFQLPRVLPDLMRKHPHGVTRQHIADHFGFPLASTTQAITALVKKGKLSQHRWPGSHVYVVTLPGVPPPSEPLPAHKRRVLDDMSRLTVNGRLEMSQRELACRFGMNPSTLNYILTSLIAQKRIRVLARGVAGKPSIYFIPSAVAA